MQNFSRKRHLEGTDTSQKMKKNKIITNLTNSKKPSNGPLTSTKTTKNSKSNNDNNNKDDLTIFTPLFNLLNTFIHISEHTTHKNLNWKIFFRVYFH